MTESITQHTGYNGWKNYETWAVNLWIGNEEPSYRYWRGVAAEIRTEAPSASQVKSGLWTSAEAARFTLADRLKDEFQVPESITGMWSDLLGTALSEVDWNEVADALLEE